MSGRTSRQKGKRGEQEVARVLRTLCPDTITKRAGGETAHQGRGADLLGTDPFAVQVKLRAGVSIGKAIREAGERAETGRLPVAFTRVSRAGQPAQPWLVTMKATDWLAMAAVYMAMRKTMPMRVAELEDQAYAKIAEVLRAEG